MNERDAKATAAELKRMKQLNSELLAVAKELREHAHWMGCPPGYGAKDFRPMFERADTVIKRAEGKPQ